MFREKFFDEFDNRHDIVNLRKLFCIDDGIGQCAQGVGCLVA